jgi:transcriptional repressor NrdR
MGKWFSNSKNEKRNRKRRRRKSPRKNNFSSTPKFLALCLATICSALGSFGYIMRCPKCGNNDDKVIDSRQSRDNTSIRRRRVCLVCSFRYTTYEQVERSHLRVVKRDRTHEAFDRRELSNSIAKACEKRPIGLVRLEETVEEIVHEIETGGSEISSTAIGEKVLAKLRDLDEVAYLRYASVHHRFENVDRFVDEIQALARHIKPDALQRELFPGTIKNGRV